MYEEHGFISDLPNFWLSQTIFLHMSFLTICLHVWMEEEGVGHKEEEGEPGMCLCGEQEYEYEVGTGGN